MSRGRISGRRPDRVGAWTHAAIDRTRRTPRPSSGWSEPIGVRIRDVGEIAAGLPHLLGFRPRESVVLLSLGGESGRRVGLTVRADIPPPEHNRELAAVLSRSLRTDRPDGALVLVVSEAADDDRATAVSRTTTSSGRCAGRCPGWPCRSRTRCSSATAGGGPTTVPTVLRSRRRHAPAGGRDRTGGRSIATGSVVAGDREDLVARIAPPPGHDRDAMAAACARIGVECSAAILDAGPERGGRASRGRR